MFAKDVDDKTQNYLGKKTLPTLFYWKTINIHHIHSNGTHTNITAYLINQGIDDTIRQLCC